MRLASYVLSITLHVGLILAILFWPGPPPIKLNPQAVQISLVDGAMGGNRAPSPVLGPQGTKGEKIAPSMPAPQKAEAAPPAPTAQETPIAQPKQDVQKPQTQPKSKPKPEPEPEPEKATPIAQKKKPDVKPEPKTEPKPEAPKPKKEDAKKAETKPDAKKEDAKPAPKKEETKNAQKSSADAVKEALAKAKAASSREASPQRGSAVERALAEAKRKAGGVGGGGGGEGDGPGGGGIGDVYIGQVMMAVRPNWGFASASRQNLTCSVRVQVDAQGKVQRAELEQSSGNSLFDTSAVNAVKKTGTEGQFPPPPGPQYYDLILSFNLNELAGR
ncbi:MAG: cell envelope integrity protein TolA [Desulfovibrionaceae bacterium]